MRRITGSCDGWSSRRHVPTPFSPRSACVLHVNLDPSCGHNALRPSWGGDPYHPSGGVVVAHVVLRQLLRLGVDGSARSARKIENAVLPHQLAPPGEEQESLPGAAGDDEPPGRRSVFVSPQALSRERDLVCRAFVVFNGAPTHDDVIPVEVAAALMRSERPEFATADIRTARRVSANDPGWLLPGNAIEHSSFSATS